MDRNQTHMARQGLLLGLLGVLIFGLTLPMSRLAVRDLDPVFVALGRALLAGVCAAVAIVVGRFPTPRRQEWPRLALFAFCVVLVFPLLMTIAMRTVPSSHGGVVLGILPLLTAMASVAIARERPSPAFWFWGVVGTVLVVAYAVLSADGAQDLHWADGLLAIGAIGAALGYALGGELTRRMGGVAVISWALVVSMPFVIGLAAVVRPPINWAASAPSWLGFLYVAIFSQFLGFFAWNRGLALGGIARVGQLQLLQTFVTLAAAALLLGEHVGVLELAFSAAVVGTIVLGWRTRVSRRD